MHGEEDTRTGPPDGVNVLSPDSSYYKLIFLQIEEIRFLVCIHSITSGKEYEQEAVTDDSDGLLKQDSVLIEQHAPVTFLLFSGTKAPILNSGGNVAVFPIML